MFETMVLILKKQRLQSKLKSKMISRERGMGTWVMGWEQRNYVCVTSPEHSLTSLRQAKSFLS